MVSDKLTAFLRSCMNREVILGQFDCGLWLADWYMVATGKPDPAWHLRGTAYEADAIRYQLARIAIATGLEIARNPKCGDIGLIALSDDHYVGAIFSGRKWWVLGENGGLSSVHPSRLHFAIAWHIE